MGHTSRRSGPSRAARPRHLAAITAARAWNGPCLGKRDMTNTSASADVISSSTAARANGDPPEPTPPRLRRQGPLSRVERRAMLGLAAGALFEPHRPLMVNLIVTRRCNLACGYCHEY